MDAEAAKLATNALDFVKELEEEADVEEGFEDFRAKKKEAEKMQTQGTAAEALQAAMTALEELMLKTKLKETAVRAKLREILWMSKDAAALLADLGDRRGRAVALKALTRAHLLRSKEPDAPMAALKTIKEAVTIFKELQERTLQAEALCMVNEAHLAKAVATPFDKVLVEQVELAVQASKESEEIFKELDDKGGMGRALHCTARALLRHTDEDEMLEGERFADEARDLFQDLGDRAAEVAVFMTGLSSRLATSGPESALMMAKDAAEDWQQEGGRPKDTAMALLLAAGFQLELGETDDSLELCGKSLAMSEKAGNKRGVAAALETQAAALFSKKRHEESLKCLEDMANVYQKMGDKKQQANAMLLAASMLLNQLADDVDSESQAEFNKKDAPLGILTEQVHERSKHAMEYADKAKKLFEDAQDDEGAKSVKDLVQATLDRAIQTFCKYSEPDQMYYTLSADSPLEDASKCIKEWKVPMPFQNNEDKGDGFLHIFDPAPPPKQ